MNYHTKEELMEVLRVASSRIIIKKMEIEL
ncbi:Uncharacterised protein [Clostridioides difficile]|nr:Uncharacterised protein [Clostridioides difficile]